ncbi:MAG: hypothetical protein WCY16_10165 [Weeksellaceae bacterium]
MTKGEFKSGGKMYVVRIDHFVTIRVFTKALTEHFYNKNEDFPSKLIRKEAEKILKHRLFFHGINGEYEAGYFEVSFEESEKFKKIWNHAYEFVSSRYTWLNK